MRPSARLKKKFPVIFPVIGKLFGGSALELQSRIALATRHRFAETYVT